MDRGVQKFKPKYPVQTLEKAMAVLYQLKVNPQVEGVSIAELSEKLEMGKSSVHRILDTLRSFDFVEKTSDGSGYYLGWGLFEMGNMVPGYHKLSNINYTHILDNLCGKLSETINLGVANESSVVIICKIEPDRRLRFNIEVGEREPLHATALGKMFLSEYSIDQLREYFENPQIKKITAKTIINFEEMVLQIEAIRQQGYSIDNEELCEDLVCVALPVRNFQNKICAAISVSMPANRFNEQKKQQIIEELKPAVEELSIFLGYRPTYCE